jgi:hypothetical protein
MDKELKKEDINIRIEKSVKQQFKMLCSSQETTMSEKIMDLIKEELSQKNK